METFSTFIAGKIVVTEAASGRVKNKPLAPIPALTKANIKHSHNQSAFKKNKTMVGVSDKDYDKAKKIVGNMPNVMLHTEAVNEMHCKDCGCEKGNIDPNCDCPNDGSAPATAEHWVSGANEARQLKNKDTEMMVTLPNKKGGVKTIDKKDWAQFKKRGYIQAENVEQPYLDEASLHRMNLIKKIAKHGSPKVKAALKAPSRVDNNKKKDPNNRNEAFKVKDIVIPNIGQHAGVKHEIIHIDGRRINIKPIGLSARQIKYRRGAVTAKPADLKLAKEEVEVNERNYRKEYDNYQGKPEQIANRSSRNSARRIMGDDAIKGMDVGHKDNNPLNNDPSNLQMEEPSENRREPRLRDEAKAIVKKDRQGSGKPMSGYDKVAKKYGVKPVSQMTPKEKAANDKRRGEYKAYQKKLRGGESVEENYLDEASKEGAIKIIKTKYNMFQVLRMTKGKFVNHGKPYKSLKDAEKVRSSGQHSMPFEEVEEKYTGGNRRDWHKDYDFDQDRDIIKGFVSPKAKNLAKKLVKKGEPMGKATKNIKSKFPGMSVDSITSLLKTTGIKEGKKPGLWDNIRKRRAAGKPKAKPGDKNYPKTLDIGEGKMNDLAMKIDNVVSNMKKDRIMKPFADKFKKDAMKSLDIRKSLEKILPDYVAGKSLDKVMVMSGKGY